MDKDLVFYFASVEFSSWAFCFSYCGTTRGLSSCSGNSLAAWSPVSLTMHSGPCVQRAFEYLRRHHLEASREPAEVREGLHHHPPRIGHGENLRSFFEFFP